MTTVARTGLGLASLASVLLGCWLIAVVVLVLPDRDPGSRPLWAAVAVLALALAVTSFRAVGSAPGRRRVRLILAVVSTATLGLGIAILSAAMRPSAEGYLVLVASILVAHGAFGLAWLLATNAGRRRRPGLSGAGSQR